MPGEHQERLEAELDRLKSMFHRGHSLTVRHLPGKIRYSENNKPLVGEVNGHFILIYEDIEERALDTLVHEFIEACFIVPLMKDCYEVMKHQQTVIAMQKELIHKFLMKGKEATVDGLSIPIAKMLEGT